MPLIPPPLKQTLKTSSATECLEILLKVLPMSSPEYQKALSFSNELKGLRDLRDEGVIDHEQYLLEFGRVCIRVLGFVKKVSS